MSWLWAPHSVWEWFASGAALIVYGFVLGSVLLTPLWKWLTNPFTPGGAGSRLVAGRPVHEVLAEVNRRKEAP